MNSTNPTNPTNSMNSMNPMNSIKDAVLKEKVEEVMSNVKG